MNVITNAGDIWPLLDYSQLVDYVWVGGGQFARLIRRSEHTRDGVEGLSDGIALGWRKQGNLHYECSTRHAETFLTHF